MDEGRVQPERADRAVAGPAIDAATLAALYAAHAPELRRFVLGVVRDADLAGDVVQMTFVRALEHGHMARPEGFKGWLFRVALNEARMVRRRQAAGARAWRRLADRGTSPAQPPDDPLVRAESIAAVRRVVAALPAEQREVVLARLDGEKTFAQIAAELNVPLGTVLTRMRLALKRLRRALGGGA